MLIMKNRFCSFMACLLVLSGFNQAIAADTTPDPSRRIHELTVERFRQVYSQSSAVKARPVFIPLPPGEVTPTGWLRDWAEDAAHGITGHLDERNATFADGWKGTAVQALHAKPDGTGWPLEQCAYWLDGLVRLGYILHDETLINKARSRLDPVVDGVLQQGSSLIHWRPQQTVKNNFNSWAHSHMARALVAYYEATGDRRILDALVKSYRGYPLPSMQSDFAQVNGIVNIDPMLDTYVLSGDAQILGRVLAATQQERFEQAVTTWNAGQTQPGHDVIFYENVRVPALVSTWTSDSRHLGATVAALKDIGQAHRLPMGLDSGEEWHAGIGSTRNVETCNVAAGMWTDLWMLRITGHGRFADQLEQVFFNAGPAPIARDFQTMSYYQCPNRLSMTMPGQEPSHPTPGSYRFSPIGNEVLCCVGNCNRIIPNYVMHQWMATLDGGLAATLLGPCRVRTFVSGGVAVTINCQTAYPFEEEVRMTVAPAANVEFPLYVRVPQWCHGMKIEVNDKAVRPDANERGFVRILRTWSSGDVLTLHLPMEVSLQCGRETSYPTVPYFTKDPRGRALGRLEAIHNPYATVSRGPLLFALPIPDEDPNQPAAGAKWNFALNVAPASARDAIHVVRATMPARWRWSLDAPVTLTVPATVFDWKPTDVQPLPEAFIPGGSPATVTLVPYGCTKFRVTMFPVTALTWGDGVDLGEQPHGMVQ
jgi:uncharacterized protein